MEVIYENDNFGSSDEEMGEYFDSMEEEDYLSAESAQVDEEQNEVDKKLENKVSLTSLNEGLETLQENEGSTECIKASEHDTELSSDEINMSTINGIVLEYLETLGLKKSWNAFWDECSEMLIPLPNDLHPPNFCRSNFGQEEMKEFFDYFDNWEGEALSKFWSEFLTDIEENEENGTEKKITDDILMQPSILLRIYMASLPFRKNEDASSKSLALEELRGFHQSYSEEFTKDPFCLPLFAFPFVSDPMSHPVFKNVFTEEWQGNLRKKLEDIFDMHLSNRKGNFRKMNCDLQKMYKHFIGDEEKETTESEKRETTGKLDGGDEIDYLKETLVQTQERYCKLLCTMQMVVGALEESVQGKAQDLQALEAKLQKSFPELFRRINERADAQLENNEKIENYEEEAEDEEINFEDTNQAKGTSDSPSSSTNEESSEEEDTSVDKNSVVPPQCSTQTTRIRKNRDDNKTQLGENVGKSEELSHCLSNSTKESPYLQQTAPETLGKSSRIVSDTSTTKNQRVFEQSNTEGSCTSNSSNSSSSDSTAATPRDPTPKNIQPPIPVKMESKKRILVRSNNTNVPGGRGDQKSLPNQPSPSSGLNEKRTPPTGIPKLKKSPYSVPIVGNGGQTGGRHTTSNTSLARSSPKPQNRLVPNSMRKESRCSPSKPTTTLRIQSIRSNNRQNHRKIGADVSQYNIQSSKNRIYKLCSTQSASQHPSTNMKDTDFAPTVKSLSHPSKH